MHILKIITFFILLMIFSGKAHAEEVSIKLQTNVVASNNEIDLEVRTDLQKNTFLVKAVLEDSQSEKIQIKDRQTKSWINNSDPILKQPLVENIEKLRVVDEIKDTKILKFELYNKTGEYIGSTSNIKIFPKNKNYFTKLNTNILDKPINKDIVENKIKDEKVALESQTKQIEVKTLFKMNNRQMITLLACFFISMFIGFSIDLVFKEYWNIS